MTNPLDDLDPIVRIARYDESGTITMVGDRQLSIAMAQIGAGEAIVLTEIEPHDAGAHRVDLATHTVVPKDAS